MIKKNLLASIIIASTISIGNAQIKINKGTIGAVSAGVKAVSFSNADAVKQAKEAIDWMDKNNPVAGPKDPYTIRLNKLIDKLPKVEGLNMNYKVYKVIDINAFACADGSVRVFSSLMDMMTDDELIGVIGHEIGHVANKDSRDQVKAAYTRAALANGVASQSETATVILTDYGAIANDLLDAKHSRRQESEADAYSYEFIKKNGYNIMGLVSSFQKLQKMEEGTEQSKITKMFSSHPDSGKRVKEIIKKAKRDGLYKPTE